MATGGSPVSLIVCDKLLHDVLPTMNREDDTPHDIRDWIAAHS